MAIFWILLPWLILIVAIWEFHRRFAEVSRIFKFLFYAGLIGFIGSFCVPALGASIWWLELPTVAHTKTIATKDGDRYTGSLFLQRVQRYNADGEFQNGWFVNAAGGAFLMGQTHDGSLAVASTRMDRIEFFNPDGSYSQPPIEYGDDLSVSFFADALKPEEFAPIGVDLVETPSAPSPGFSISTILLFPFWSPVLAWFAIALGMLCAVIEKPSVMFNSKWWWLNRWR